MTCEHFFTKNPTMCKDDLWKRKLHPESVTGHTRSGVVSRVKPTTTIINHQICWGRVIAGKWIEALLVTAGRNSCCEKIRCADAEPCTPATKYEKRCTWRMEAGGGYYFIQNNWLVVWNIFYFSVLGRRIPTDELIFFRGAGSTTNQTRKGRPALFVERQHRQSDSSTGFSQCLCQSRAKVASREARL